ncbi:MAG: prephenate dehydratase [Bacteroidota bacterium]|nr:prephenate dehydratase [Bacteroidota bacterium]
MKKKINQDRNANRTVAFQGEDGAYSQEAIFKMFGPETKTLPCGTFDDIFLAVENGKAELGLLPIENSTAGAINQSYDLFLDHDLKISGEIIFRVRHALLAAKGSAIENIRRVYSHPQAIAQCEQFIASHGWEAVAVYDTAGAARQLAASGEPDAAAIASETAARLYGLQILATGVEDLSNNFTRFFVIGHSEPPRAEKSKTSIVFATEHVSGALYDCLGYLALRGINLTKLESRPDRRNAWHYVFYLDFEGHREDQPCRDMLNDLQNKSSFLKVLGSYPAADI